MGLFSIFRKTNPEVIYLSIAELIVRFASDYSENRSAPNKNIAAAIESEYIFLMLHLVDIHSFEILGSEKRDIVFDEIFHLTIMRYFGTRMARHRQTKDNDIYSIYEFQAAFNSRQHIYSQCDSLIDSDHPRPGTKLFAFSFFVNRALRRSISKNLDALLTGKRKLRDSDFEYLPDLTDVIQDTIFIVTTLKNMNIPENIKKLKGNNIVRIHSKTGVLSTNTYDSEQAIDDAPDDYLGSDIENTANRICDRIDNLDLRNV